MWFAPPIRFIDAWTIFCMAEATDVLTAISQHLIGPPVERKALAEVSDSHRT